MNELFEKADAAIEKGHHLLILSDRNIDDQHAPIPALLAVSGLHQHLTRENTRPLVNIILESGEPRETHHFATLIGYGASAINPYLAFETIDDIINRDYLKDVKYNVGVHNYIKASTKGIIKILSKMGISTIQSYRGAQIFEAVGVSNKLIDKYFTSTTSRIGGIGIRDIAAETLERHFKAFNDRKEESELETGSFYKWRKDGEYHLYNPETIYKLQCSCRNGDYKTFREYSALLNDAARKQATIRGLLKFKNNLKSIPIEEVESVETICRRFKTGAMSYGSISKEAHECLAIAMNRIGGKSNTGEGGEDSSRYLPMADGDSKCSAIKQVASGRFGVTSQYLVNAIEIQIKMAQGAKPGEGGQLPGEKVYPWIAKVRHSTPGVGLISPPPHHDIYSIEDLAELIHDLKNANQNARISVKLVSEIGVGTVAAGVAKGLADVVLISGYDGGTGASPRTSIRHAGLPWELGLAETHQTLLLNNLRNRIVVEADGKLMTGRDVVIAALLGAEEFGFATAPLVTLGCVMMRVCNLDTCPVGVATQNPALRKNFCGDPNNVVNFMRFIAQEMREIMAELGFRTVNEMIGRTEILEQDKSTGNYKLKGLDLSSVLYKPSLPKERVQYCNTVQDHRLEDVLDKRKLMKVCLPAIDDAKKVEASFEIKNVDRVTGTIVGSEITKKYGSAGLPEDTVKLHFKGSAGQSFGAFIPNGMTLSLEGESNDYIGKGLSGGKIAVYPDHEATFVPKENIIIGNVALYGATSGQAYICGVAGERFCVRNSGASAVVEGIGDHGCEYMTGGIVVVIGETGRNFAAGMSGGVAYVLDEDSTFALKYNKELVEFSVLSEREDISKVHELIENHLKYTKSQNAKNILENWDKYVSKFVKIIPREYKNMLQLIENAKLKGMTDDDAALAAFKQATKKSGK
jgi:glutamate synthase (ferredoxin)